MTISTQIDSSLMRLLPPIRRARGYRLYDYRGRRYLDLNLAGGRALLGHRPERMLHELKNLVSRGLLGDLPSGFDSRLARALSRLIPDHPVVRIFANEDRLLAALAEGLGAGPKLVDPAISGFKGQPATIPGPSNGPDAIVWRWRPYLPDVLPSEPERSVALPVLPFPGSFGPAVACLRGVAESELPPSDLVSPALLGALTRSAYDLLRFMEQENYDEQWWAQFDAPWWLRRGPYLVARCEKREYSVVFRRLLEIGVHISPSYPGPSVVPAECSDGELKPLRELAKGWKGG